MAEAIFNFITFIRYRRWPLLRSVRTRHVIIEILVPGRLRGANIFLSGNGRGLEFRDGNLAVWE